jgi:hypothetical protein
MIDQFMEMVRIPSESGNEAEFIHIYGEKSSTNWRAEAHIDNYGN